ncbi:HK97 family phage prohead protease [Streptosporangium jomthongense]|uniref:HK97 family phage prohead protease n=1 Tax=Streptosporangium jomthongense TaxID=1193683 RepID=A0ABV8FEM2_9ACTN
MDTKGLRVEIKDADKGLVTAVFATYNKADSDSDVTLPGAFEDGAEMPISAYGHTSWEGALPPGKGRIRTTSKEAILEAEFFMDTAHGIDTFKTVQRLGKLGQWSYGYDATKFSYGEHEGKRVRFLEALKVHEVSPVLLGAGVNTRTLSAKSGAPGVAPRRGRALAPHDSEVTSRSWDGAKTIAGLADDLRPSELRTVFAWMDADADPEAKSSYRLAHHHGVGGPANVRACLMGIARLNDPAKGGIPDADRAGVYEHLAGHLRDADIEPPELRTQPGGSLKYAEEGHAVLAAVSAFVDRTAEVVALRALKGKGMAPRSAELLDWIDADLQRLKALLSTPLGVDDPSEAEIASLFARSVAQLNGM